MLPSPRMLAACLVLALSPTALPLFAGTNDPVLEGKIDPIFEVYDHADQPGASVAVIRDGKLIFSKGYGSAQLEYGIPVTTETLFHVASVSKQFTAMAIMLLEADGKLSLEDEVQKHLPWVPRFDYPVTVRQMVNHTSGIRDQWELLYMAGWRIDDVITMDDIRTKMKSQKELNFVPQSDTLYSNMAYTLLADIVAAVSGQSFTDYTRQHIFEPLNMHHTHFHMDHQEIDPGRSYSYFKDENGVLKKSVLSYANAGATSLFTTAEDLTLWLDNFRIHKIGNGRVINNMLAVPKLLNGEPAHLYGADYAGGLMIDQHRGLNTFGHGGADAGFRAQVQWFPDYNLGIAVTSNSANANAGGDARKVADVVLEGHFPEPLPEKVVANTEPGVDLPADLLQSYAGDFQIEGLGPLKLLVAQNQLQVELPGKPATALRAVSETEFILDAGGAKLTFEESADGNHDQITVNLGVQTFSANRVQPVVLTPETVARYTGEYYSPELGVPYEVVELEGALVLRIRRHGDVPLITKPASEPGAAPTEFLGNTFYASKVVFDIDSSGEVNGFRLDGSRVKNLWFEKRAP